MNGVVEGGWSFVWAAYSLSALLLAAWGVRALLLLRDASHHAEHGEG